MIYLDNAATSFPKAPNVEKAMIDFMQNIGASSGRGAYENSVKSAEIVYLARKKLAQILGLKDFKRIIFTHNATHAINIILQGFLHSGDRVVTTQMEHNAIMRTLHYLREKRGIEICQIPCNELCEIDLQKAKEMLKGAKLMAISHANNVSGAILPIQNLSTLAKEFGVKILLDGAQSIGCVPCKDIMQFCDFLAFSAHKALLAPMGVGVLAFAQNVDFMSVEPLIFGGTGSLSEQEIQPDFLPDRFESGTMNMHGIAGLLASLQWIEKVQVSEIFEREKALRNKLVCALQEIQNLKIYCPSLQSCNGVLSVNFQNLEPKKIAHILDKKYKIAVRSGLHCNASTHKVLKSFECGGTIRLSAGFFTKDEEIEKTIAAFWEIAKKNC